jgi:hypothetical protein
MVSHDVVRGHEMICQNIKCHKQAKKQIENTTREHKTFLNLHVLQRCFCRTVQSSWYAARSALMFKSRKKDEDQHVEARQHADLTTT